MAAVDIDIREALFERLLLAKRRGECLGLKILSQDLGRAISTIHHHVIVLRRCGAIEADSLYPPKGVTKIPPAALVRPPGGVKPQLKIVTPRNAKHHLLAKLDTVLNSLGQLPSELPEFEQAYDELLELREWVNKVRL